MCLTKLLYDHTKFDTVEMLVKGKKLRVWLADSPRKDMIGLMHRQRIGADGMLFTPGRDARHGIWMLNMKFPIDILWLDSSWKVVDIIQNVKPCKSIFSCPTYRPKSPARYVLELGAGRAAKLGLKIGSKITLRELA